ncbi:MAG: zinc ribbon domain-containing protein, partial [Desulfobacteraceae bacterium]|nr:zinc ribbon domain-containing protein [Desulfobacteraceae bacterium]
MENSCPDCGKEIQPYHQFCPWCDADFSSDRKNGQTESAKEPVKENLTCPACGKSIQAYHEFCPWCNVDFPINEQPQADNLPQTEEPLSGTGETAEHQAQNLHNEPVQSDTLMPGSSYCSGCGNPLIAGFRVCNACGVAVQGIQTHEPAPTDQNETAFIQPPGQVIQHQHTGNQVTEWKFDGPVPLSIHFNTGKIYRKNIIDVLEFQIVNNSPWPINDLIFIVKGKLISKPLAEQLSFILMPGIVHAFHVTGFIPYHPGKDALKITITGKTSGQGEFHLSGTALVTVRDEIKKTSPQKIDVNISSEGPLIVDME